jgi:NAD dependent epimerase/dehydratase family enzyme
VDFLIQNQDCAGPYNISSPNPVKNHALMTHLRTKQRVPFALPQPVFLLEFGAWIIGTETELLLKSRNVYPQRLLDSGFKFSFPEIEAALSHL